MAVRRYTAIDSQGRSRAFRVHTDHLGTGRAGTDMAGNVIWEDFHTPFGESLLHPDATDDQGDYTGHIRDKSSDLTYMQARYYDPLIGRFMGEDPVGMLDTGNPSQFNRYSYVSNNPINSIDPTGMVERELNRPDKGQTINVEAGDLSQEQVNKIADQLPQGVFDTLDGQDLSDHSVRTQEFSFKSGNFSNAGSEGQDIINIGNQIGTGLVPPSEDFPAATGLVHAKTDTKNGEALTNGRSMISSLAVKKGISQVISTSVHERRHQAPGDKYRSEKSIHEDTAKALSGTGVKPR